MDDSHLTFLKNLKTAMECADIEEMKHLLSRDLHEVKQLVESIMNFSFNRELAKLIWSFLKQPKFDVNETSLVFSLEDDDDLPQTPLTLATELEQPEVIKLLLKIPSLDVNQPAFFDDETETTALQTACQYENFEVIKP